MTLDQQIQWYNENEGRSYPLAEAATKLTDNGQLLPNDIIVDMGLMLRPDYPTAYLSYLRITSHIVTVGVCYGARRCLFLGTYARSSIIAYKAYPLIPSMIVDDISGWIAFGSHTATSIENYAFSSMTQSAIERRAITIIDRVPVSRLTRYNGTIDQWVNKTVRLVAGSGVSIRLDPLNSQRILIGMTDDLANAMCNKCNQGANESSCGTAPMRCIDGVCPDANGLLTIEFT